MKETVLFRIKIIKIKSHFYVLFNYILTLSKLNKFFI